VFHKKSAVLRIFFSAKVANVGYGIPQAFRFCACVDKGNEVYYFDYQFDKLHQPHAQNVAVRSI